MKYILPAILILLSSCKTQINREITKDEVKVLQADLAFKYKAQLGEGALWNGGTQELYWVDIEGKEFHRYDPQTGKDQSYSLPSRVGTVVSVDENKVMVALENGVYLLDLESGKTTLFSDVNDDEVPSRFNDGKLDPNGNFWVGSMPLAQDTNTGKLYKIEPSGDATIMHRNIGISNGIVWTKDQSTMYFIDTKKGNIRAFDYDVATSTISNERVAVTIPEEMGYPDGMAIDENDQLWVGLWNGNKIAHYDPTNGKLLSIVNVPAHNVTSCAFGGKNLDELYITTASIDMNDEEKARYPLAGSIFMVKPGVNGVTAPAFGRASN